MLVYESETQLDDPHVAMQTVRVMFEEPLFNYQTQMNGTRREIAEYFRGAELNVRNSEDPGSIRTPYRLEFIDHSDGQPTVAVILADAFNAAWGEYLRLKKEAANAAAWMQDIDGVTRPTLRKIQLQNKADLFWSENYRLLNSLPKPLEKMREAAL